MRNAEIRRAISVLMLMLLSVTGKTFAVYAQDTVHVRSGIIQVAARDTLNFQIYSWRMTSCSGGICTDRIGYGPCMVPPNMPLVIISEILAYDPRGKMVKLPNRKYRYGVPVNE